MITIHPLTKTYISQCITTQNAFGVLETLCNLSENRLGGTAQEKKAAVWVVEEFKKLGYEADLQPVTYPGWHTGAAKVNLKTATTTQEFPASTLGWSPPKEVEGPMVDVGYGMEEDFNETSVEGHIVLVSAANKPGGPGLHRSEKYQFAVDRGAIGFVMWADRPGGLLPMGSISLDGAPGTIPAVGITYEDSFIIKRFASEHALEIGTKTTLLDVTSYNAVGYKPGATSEEVVVGAHLDTWYCPGAFDNGSGSAMVVELAKQLASFELNRGIRFITFGSEELGLLGSKSYVAQCSTLDTISAMLNLDVCAIREGSPHLNSLENPKLKSWLEALIAQLQLPITVQNSSSPHSDHYPFYEKGVPACWAVTSGSPFSFAHTVYDTLDKMSPEAFTLPMLVCGAILIELAQSNHLFRQ
jgi:Iap family predicted aminopeptidase